MRLENLPGKQSTNQEAFVTSSTIRRPLHVDEATLFSELIPLWKRWGYAKGYEEGYAESYKRGYEEGEAEVLRKVLNHGFSPEAVAKAVEMPLEAIEKLRLGL